MRPAPAPSPIAASTPRGSTGRCRGSRSRRSTRACAPPSRPSELWAVAGRFPVAEINLLDRYPRTRRDIASRAAAVPEQRAIAKRFEREYFDGDRGQGYGGYRYDGRWVPLAGAAGHPYPLRARVLRRRPRPGLRRVSLRRPLGAHRGAAARPLPARARPARPRRRLRQRLPPPRPGPGGARASRRRARRVRLRARTGDGGRAKALGARLRRAPALRGPRLRPGAVDQRAPQSRPHGLRARPPRDRAGEPRASLCPGRLLAQRGSAGEVRAVAAHGGDLFGSRGVAAAVPRGRLWR